MSCIQKNTVQTPFGILDEDEVDKADQLYFYFYDMVNDGRE